METNLSTEANQAGYELSYLERPDGARIAVYGWPAPAKARAVVQITHGLAEHAARYDRLARALTQAGYLVYASDHRGHGKSVRDASELGFFADEDGFQKVVGDLFAVNRHIASRHPSLPRVLFAHSFGSFVAQAYLFEHSESVDAVVLSGTTRANPLVVGPGLVLARALRAVHGPRGTSWILQKLSFGSYNDAFQPTRTDFDWLSRDPSEVDKYVSDPLCGFDTTVQGWIDLFGGLLHIRSSELQRRLPKDLPIYIFSGDQDPVGDRGKGPASLAKRLAAAGLRRVKLKLYPGARHELLNETHRDEVTGELIAWLDEVIATRER